MNALTNNPLRVLQISTYDGRGAGRAAYRLNQGLQQLGLPSQLLVQSKSSDDRSVTTVQSKLEKGLSKFRPFLSQLPLRSYGERETTDFSPSWLPDTLYKRALALQPDIINLHWLGDGCLDVKSLAKWKQPIVWTIHDMWAFTGGCHYSQGCDRYLQSCGACPQLSSTGDRDLSRSQWHRKAKAFQRLDLTIVSPSRWLADCARSSSLLRGTRIEVIPNGIDVMHYRPCDRATVRDLLHLPQDKQLILFGAIHATQDKRKGFHLLQAALNELSKTSWRDQIELVVFGASQPQEPTDLGFKTHYFGRLADDISLSLLYGAADVFVAPSVEDNLPNTVLESLACGTPAVAFNIGGMPDLIEHQQNGYLAQPYRVEDLVQGIVWVVEDPLRHQQLCQRSRQKVEAELTLQLQAERYFRLYQDILKHSS